MTFKWFILFALALLAVAFLPTSASAQANNCMTDVSGVDGCTANDVSVAAINSVQVISGGSGDSCFEGGTFSFVANFTIKTTSNKARNNIGLFFGTGQPSALHGTCTDAILSPTYTCPGTGGVNQPAAIICGDTTYEELTTKTSSGVPEPSCPASGGSSTEVCGCGDTSSTDDNGLGFQFANLEITGVKCSPTPCPASLNLPAGSTCVAMPECTSWFQPTDTVPSCTSGAASKFPWQPQAIPGTSSKCTCTTLFVPVQPISPKISVAKTCDIGNDTTPGQMTCHAGPQGNTVVYTVAITNNTPANEGGVIIDQICDDQFGNIFTASGFGGKACPAGALCTGANAVAGGSCITSTTCSSTLPGDISNASAKSCTFTVSQGENTSVADIVTATGHSDISGVTASTGGVKSNSVTVDSTDAPTTATTSLGYPATPLQHACVTVRYNVTVANTSAADESITLNQVGVPGTAGYVSALFDGAFADITQDHGAGDTGTVTGTTCGVATTSSGQGTLNGSAGAGAFPQTLIPGTCSGAGCPPTNNGGTYKCQFDGIICGKPTPIASPSCAAGLQIPDTTGVNANLSLDNGEVVGPGITFTETSNPFTTTICLIPE